MNKNINLESKEKSNNHKYMYNNIVQFDPSKYSFNYFWQTNEISTQKVVSIISNYLDSINTICEKFGTDLVKEVLKNKYKQIHTDGEIVLSGGMSLPVEGHYRDNEIYKSVLSMINEKCSKKNYQ